MLRACLDVFSIGLSRLKIPVFRIPLILVALGCAGQLAFQPTAEAQGTSPASPSKENIYSGGKLIATEQPGSTVVPSPPTGTQATANSHTQITVTWTDTSNYENGFIVERKYDAENRLVDYNNAAATYVYDGNSRRVKKVAGSVTTLFVYDAAGRSVAEYTTPAQAQAGGTSFLTTDHLGSTRIVTDNAATPIGRYDYYPWGEEIAASLNGRSSIPGYTPAYAVRQKFTSKERDVESSLDYFLARYYSGAQGRFTSPDEFKGGPLEFTARAIANPTFYADLTNPQSLNKYQYGFNNPLRYLDPDGHEGQESIWDQVVRSTGALFDSFVSLFGGSEDEAAPNVGPLPESQKLVRGSFETLKTGTEVLSDVITAADPVGGSSIVRAGMTGSSGKIDGAGVAVAAAGTAFNFASPGKALSHFTKHAGEFGSAFKNAVQYLKGARSFVESAGSDVVRYKNAAGKVLVYNEKTNELATHTGKKIHTYFKPKRGQTYVDDVIKRENYQLIK